MSYPFSFYEGATNMFSLRRSLVFFLTPLFALGASLQCHAQIQVNYGSPGLGGLPNNLPVLTASAYDNTPGKGGSGSRNIFGTESRPISPGRYEETTTASATEGQIGFAQFLRNHGVDSATYSNPFSDGPDPSKYAAGTAGYYLQFGSGWTGVGAQEIGFRIADVSAATNNFSSASGGGIVDHARTWFQPSMTRVVSGESAVHADLVFELRYGTQGSWQAGNIKSYSAWIWRFQVQQHSRVTIR
jgi:hypothetical protein